MKIRFNKFEKVAGLFVGVAALSCVVGLAGMAIKNGWLSSKVFYFTELESADGVHAGTLVQISGLRVGEVTDVELQSNDKVLVKFFVLEKFSMKVRQSSQVQMFRPFILADKVMEISNSDLESPVAEPGFHIAMLQSSDIMDLLSGKKMGALLGSFDKVAESMRVVGDAFADPKRTKAMVQMLDRMGPLVANLNTMSVDLVKITNSAAKEKRVEIILDNLAKLTKALGEAGPAFAEEVPNLGKQVGQIVASMNVLTTEFQRLTPAIAVLAPDLPRTSRRAVEALDELVVLMKAMQKSFLLSGKVRDVREAEEAAEKNRERQPATE